MGQNGEFAKNAITTTRKKNQAMHILNAFPIVFTNKIRVDPPPIRGKGNKHPIRSKVMVSK